VRSSPGAKRRGRSVSGALATYGYLESPVSGAERWKCAQFFLKNFRNGKLPAKVQGIGVCFFSDKVPLKTAYFEEKNLPRSRIELKVRSRKRKGGKRA
jgi:hypothetical protein